MLGGRPRSDACAAPRGRCMANTHLPRAHVHLHDRPLVAKLTDTERGVILGGAPECFGSELHGRQGRPTLAPSTERLVRRSRGAASLVWTVVRTAKLFLGLGWSLHCTTGPLSGWRLTALLINQRLTKPAL